MEMKGDDSRNDQRLYEVRTIELYEGFKTS